MTYTAFKAPAELSRTARGVWLLHFRCPICGTFHTHGGGDGPEPACFGTRAPHCVFDRYRSAFRVFVVDKDYNWDVQPDTADVDWRSEYRSANTHVVAQVEAADLQRADREILLGRLSRNLEKALKTLP